jgi:hypothetical protein
MVSLDDMIIYSRTEGEPEQHVLVILRTLAEAGFIYSEEQWAQSEQPYLGHFTSGECVRQILGMCPR